MKYYFTNECYWDSEEKKIFRKNEEVDLTPSQTKIMAKLIKNNGTFVEHKELYFAMTGSEPCGEWKPLLSNQFTRNKSNEKGILIRVSEINPFFDRKRDQGYKISVPEENIKDSKLILNNSSSLEKYQDIWFSNTYFENQKQKFRKIDNDRISKKVRYYLQGESCSWPLIFSPSQYTPVKRNIVEEIKNAVENEIGAIVLTGAGGEGKTTVLMQLCFELFNSGKTVLFHAPTYKFDFPDDLEDGIFIIDNPSNTFEFKMFLSQAIKEGFTVIMAARSNEWLALKEALLDDTKRNIREIEIPKLSKDESRAFAIYLKKYVFEIRKSINELEKLFFTDSYGFLYASMLMAIHNKDSLESIAEEIISGISKLDDGENTLKILASIVFAEQSGINIGARIFKEICKAFDIDNVTVNQNLRKEVVQNGNVYQTRHESISNLFYKYLFVDGEWWNYFDEEEREDVIITILDIYLEKISKSNKDVYSTDFLAIDTSALVLQAFKTITFEETHDYILQRFFESCQLHGCGIIDKVYDDLENDEIKNKLAKICFDHKLPLWGIYSQWLSCLITYEKSNIDFFKTICIDMCAPIDIWLIWIKFENKLKNYGDVEEEYTVRWIFRESCDSHPDDSRFWLHWAMFESRLGNYGDINTKYTARWLYNNGFSLKDSDFSLRLHWGMLESSLGNYGDINTKYTARWLYNDGCNLKGANYVIWDHWGQLESSLGNYGDVDMKYTARWIFKRGCDLGSTDSSIWLHWARLEIDFDNIGDIETEYTARWILKKACEIVSVDRSIWLFWAQLESDLKNYGDINTAYTARWIYKQACTKFDLDPLLYHNWIQLENSLGDNGNNDVKYSIRELLEENCSKMAYNPSFWGAWAKIEEWNKNIGNYETEYSAAWLFKEACTCSKDYCGGLWRSWVNFAIRCFDHYDLKKDIFLCDALKNRCLSGTTAMFPWLAWAKIEEFYGNIGDYSTEYSAAWLYHECCMFHNPTDELDCWSRWMKFASNNPMNDSAGNLINYDYVFNYAIENYPSVRDKLIKMTEQNE